MLAVWTFIHPAILAHANRFVQQLQLAKPSKGRAGDPTAAKTGTDGHSNLGRVKLSRDRVQDLQNYLNNLGVLYDANGNDMVPIIKQRHGDMVRLQTGHMHQVENLEACVKIAWDKYVAANRSRYALSWLYVTRWLVAQTTWVLLLLWWKMPSLSFLKTASTSKDDAAISLHDDLLDDLATLAEQRM